jgi:hypothetical protein
MARSILSVMLIGALAAAACGATTPDRGATAPSQAPTSQAPPAPSAPTEVSGQRGVIPAGTEIDVRLQTALTSESATPEQRFEAVTVVDLTQNGQVLVPAGTVVRGVVSDVKKAGRIERTGSLTLSFDQMRVRGRDVAIRAMATQVFESGGIREEVGTAGAGAGVGGIIGGILGGVRGAVLGAVIGAGGAIAATDGKDITLPAGSIMRIRVDSPVNVAR